jgi:hypothetical protein
VSSKLREGTHCVVVTRCVPTGGAVRLKARSSAMSSRRYQRSDYRDPLCAPEVWNIFLVGLLAAPMGSVAGLACCGRVAGRAAGKRLSLMRQEFE